MTCEGQHLRDEVVHYLIYISADNLLSILQEAFLFLDAVGNKIKVSKIF